MIDTTEAQVLDVQRRFPAAHMESAPDGQRVLVVPGVRLAAGWNMSTVTIKVMVPVGYPQVKPDSFCADAGLRLQSGLDPTNSALQPIFGGQHRWFSWHLLSWEPTTGSLDQYVRFCERRLRDPR